MSIKDITIIIASFRSDKKIKECINSIDEEVKIIVVENSNNTDFKKSIESQFNNVECVLSGDNLGYGKANNIGLKKATTKFALILNPDAILDPKALINFINATKEVKEFAIMGPFIQEEKEINKKINLNITKPIEVNNVKGFAMFLNLSEFKDYQFFDENFFFYFEEIDLCKRLIKNGKKIYLVPNIRIKHDGAQSHDSSINLEMEMSRNWHWMWSTFYYHKKHKSFLMAFIIIFPKLASAILKTLIHFLLFNEYKRKIYYQRLSGIINSIFGRKSWYRPKV